jgi:hypothetical protein
MLKMILTLPMRHFPAILRARIVTMHLWKSLAKSRRVGREKTEE